MERDHNIELLNKIYEGAEMGRDILGRLIPLCYDGSLRCSMAEQFAEYHRILVESERLLLNAGHIAKPASRAARAPIYASLRLNLKIDGTSSHLAEMLMQGNLMGYIDIARGLSAYTGAKEETRHLAERLMAMEDNNMKQMRRFL